jgi:hypothetical protein
VLAALTALTLCASPAAAQRTGSRFLPVDHWAYEQVATLRARGYLTNLNPLVQPYARLDVARGLAYLNPDSLRPPMAGWVRLLKAELAAELALLSGQSSPAWGLELMTGARGASSRRLDPARPTGSGGVWPWWRGGAWVEAGPLAAETRIYGDRYFRADPDGYDPGFDPTARRGGRTDNAYVTVALPFGGIQAGHLVRNWGVVGSPGLVLSGWPTPYPQIALDVRVGKVVLRSVMAELDTVAASARHFIAHRLDYQTRDLVVSVGEATVYAHPTFLLRFLNPFELLVLDQSDRPQQNLMLTAQIWLRRGRVVLYADGLLDDIDLAPATPDPEPPQYGFTLGTRVVPSLAWLEIGAQYQQVGAWTYRTPNVVDRYSYFNRGLGANYSDYDRLSLWADVHPGVPGLRLSPVVTLQRQGEGNFRDSIPGGTYWGRPAIFLGVTETTIRLALRGRYQPLRALWLEWDVGPSVVRDRGHVTGVRGTDFEGVGSIGLRLDFPSVRSP